MLVYFPSFVLSVDTSSNCLLSYEPLGSSASLESLHYVQRWCSPSLYPLELTASHNAQVCSPGPAVISVDGSSDGSTAGGNDNDLDDDGLIWVQPHMLTMSLLHLPLLPRIFHLPPLISSLSRTTFAPWQILCKIYHVQSRWPTSPSTPFHLLLSSRLCHQRKLSNSFTILVLLSRPSDHSTRQMPPTPRLTGLLKKSIESWVATNFVITNLF